jgi:histidinol dehydrogenase
MFELVNWSTADALTREELLARPRDEAGAGSKARAIVDDVVARGEVAIREYAAQFDEYAPASFRVDIEDLRAARLSLGAAEVEAIKSAAHAIRKFHIQQGYSSYSVETWAGVTAQRRVSPIDTVGLYVPAGSAPLVSTLMMLGIPAQLAGVERIIVCVPPSSPEGVSPAVLATAEILGLTEVYALGGAQAVAAMAVGAAGIPAVDKIFGPGNSYVSEAKSYVASLSGGCAIDLPAGPSEVLVLADSKAAPTLLASDLLSQAEHDPMAQVILLFDAPAVCDAVIDAIELQLADLPRASIARQSLRNARAIQYGDLTEALEIVNAYAPEHLIIQTVDAETVSQGVRNAGSIFIGPWAPEAAGDYAAGPNHTLPTGGAAKAYSGLSVEAFQKTTTVLRASQSGATQMASTVERLAKLEGLEAHRRAMACRRPTESVTTVNSAGAKKRTAAYRRKTAETDITVSIDLDRAGPCSIDTGIGFFDHMIEQVGRHAGVFIRIKAEGDLHIDAHHTIEDVCLALGTTLREALGERLGLARFGFELPMDESRAGVWIDLSGRAFSRFDGVLPAGSIGDFPIEMTPHVFRSLADAMGAAIHVTIEGENAHHMVEACFKALGRALGQAVQQRGEILPSTKEYLA